MKGTRKNLTACLFAALVFGSSAVYLERGNAGLSEEILERESSSFKGSFGSTIPRSRRQQSLGNFLDQYRQAMTAKELQRLIVRSYQSGYPDWPLLREIYAMQLSKEELAQLRVDVFSLNCPSVMRERILGMIAEAESRFYDDSLESLFDFVIGTSGLHGKFRSDFIDWAKNDPQAAIAWFRSKDPVEDFKNGSFSGAESRSALFRALLNGLTEVRLESAIEVIESEPNVDAYRDIPWAVIEGLIEDARESGSDELVQRLLEAHPVSTIRSDDPFSNSNFWSEFTKATGDVERSVLLLGTLNEIQGYGIAMAQIIDGVPDLTFEERADWLTESMPASNHLAEGLYELSKEDGSPFAWGPMSSEVIPWLEKYPAGEVKDTVLTSLSQRLSNHREFSEALQLVDQIADLGQQESSRRKVAQDWLDVEPEEAGQHLPADLIQSLAK